MCDIVKNLFLSGLYQYLRPLVDSNMGIVTIQMWSQNLILTTKTVLKTVLVVLGLKTPENSFLTVLFVKI